MRIIGSCLVFILILSACVSDDGQLPTQARLPAPTKTLVPTTEAQFLATQIAAGTLPVELTSDDPTTTTSVAEQPTEDDTAGQVPQSTQADPTAQEPTAEPPTATMTETPSPTATDTPAPTNTPIECNLQEDWDTYIIQRGDNLIRIASLTDSTVDELTEANCLTNPNQIRAGQEIYVPNPPATPTEAPTATPTATMEPVSEATPTSDVPEQPSFSVSINKTFTSEIDFALDFPASWFVTESTSSTVENAIITSFDYTLGDEIPQNRWSDDMVSITVTVFQETTDDSLSDWTQSILDQFQNATNIEEVLNPVAFRTDSEIEGQSIDYVSTDDTIVRNYYFIINNHKVQLSIGGNFELAVPVVNSLRLVSEG